MKKNILLVDNEQIFRFIHSKVVEKSGVHCDIRKASNGSDILEMVNG
jgi:hypothetical protein